MAEYDEACAVRAMRAIDVDEYREPVTLGAEWAESDGIGFEQGIANDLTILAAVEHTAIERVRQVLLVGDMPNGTAAALSDAALSAIRESAARIRTEIRDRDRMGMVKATANAG